MHGPTHYSFRKTWVFFCLLFLACNVQSLEVKGTQKEYGLSSDIEYLVATDNQFKPNLIERDRLNELFKRTSPNDQELNLGFIAGLVWIRISLSRDPGVDSSWILEIPYLGLGEVNLYQPNGKILKNGSLIEFL